MEVEVNLMTKEKEMLHDVWLVKIVAPASSVALLWVAMSRRV